MATFPLRVSIIHFVSNLLEPACDMLATAGTGNSLFLHRWNRGTEQIWPGTRNWNGLQDGTDAQMSPSLTLLNSRYSRALCVAPSRELFTCIKEHNAARKLLKIICVLSDFPGDNLGPRWQRRDPYGKTFQHLGISSLCFTKDSLKYAV